jgi:hypothetical protein
MQYTDMLNILMDKEIQDIDLNPLIERIETLRNGTYWESKNERLSCLIDSQEIAEILAKNTIGFNMQIQEAVGRIAPAISKKCSYVDALKNASDVIEACDECIYIIVYGETIHLDSFWQLEPETYDYIKLANYNPPMVEKPNDWISNDDGGYYDTDMHCILGSKYNQHNQEQALDVLNILQDIEWELDPTIVAMEMEPNKQFSSPESHEQFVVFAANVKEMCTKYLGKVFWFPVQFDKRGRMYTRGYHITNQGSGYQKASLNFHKKELIEGEL